MWCNEDYDALIEQAISVADVEQRKQLYKRANRLIFEQVPLMPIAHALRYQAQRADISNVEINTYGGVQLGKVERTK